MPSEIALAVLLLLCAPAVGSFLGVVIDRVPRGEDVVARRSACRACARPLAPRDLVPVLSFVARRGRCASCGAAIPPWLLYTELAATGAALVALAAGGGPLQVLLNAGLLWLLLALAVSDLQWLRLPDVLVASLGLLVAAHVILFADPGAAALGAALGAGSFWGLRAGYRRLRGREGLGLGDVKLMAPLGALTGPWDLPLMVLLAALVALAAALILGARAGHTLDAAQPLPFGAPLCAATALVHLFWVGAI